MKLSSLSLVLLLVMMIGSASAQKLWEKPYHNWSQEDAAKVLNGSPWVRQYQSSEGMAAIQRDEARRTQSDMSVNNRIGSMGGDPGSKGRDVAMPVITIRLHSGMPVRQALVRLQEINGGYDKMDKQKQAEFDEKTKKNLECPFCQKYYIVTMNKSVAAGENVEEGLFQTTDFAQLKGNVWLITETGEKSELEQFIPAKNAKDLAIFFFPRKTASGSELISPKTKTFRFEFNNSFLTNGNSYAKIIPRTTEFKVSNLIINEAVAF